MQSIADIAKKLNNGGLIIFPTDTIWGIGCRIDKLDSIKRIFAIKKRDFNKPFPIIVDSVEMLKQYVEDIHPRVETLLNLHAHPLTVVYPKAKNITAPVAHETGSVAIRIVKDPFCNALIKETGIPLVATSANFSGEPFPNNFSEIDVNLLELVDLVVDHRQNEKSKGKPSVIASYDDKGELEFLRT